MTGALSGVQRDDEVKITCFLLVCVLSYCSVKPVWMEANMNKCGTNALVEESQGATESREVIYPRKALPKCLGEAS